MITGMVHDAALLVPGPGTTNSPYPEGAIMDNPAETVPIESAKAQVRLGIRRLALLHLAFSETLMEELGREVGRKLIVKAIRNFGTKIGVATREAALRRGDALTPENRSGGKNDYPSLGTHDRSEQLVVDGEQRMRAYGCELEKVWKEYGREDLGRLYCIVDLAQSMAYNPEQKFVHTKAEPDHDSCCEFVYRPTTPEERDAFARGVAWEDMDFGNH
jgi:hypothetical protein